MLKILSCLLLLSSCAGTMGISKKSSGKTDPALLTGNAPNGSTLDDVQEALTRDAASFKHQHSVEATFLSNALVDLKYAGAKAKETKAALTASETCFNFVLKTPQYAGIKAAMARNWDIVVTDGSNKEHPIKFALTHGAEAVPQHVSSGHWATSSIGCSKKFDITKPFTVKAIANLINQEPLIMNWE